MKNIQMQVTFFLMVLIFIPIKDAMPIETIENNSNVCKTDVMSFNSDGIEIYSFNDSTIRTLIKDVNRVKLIGNCCVVLFQGLNYGKQNQTLPIGFDDTPQVKTIRSFRIEQCHSDI